MSRLARRPRFCDGRLPIGPPVGPPGRGAAMSTVVVVILLRLVRRFWHALPCDAAWPRSEAWQAGGVPGPSDTGALVGLGVGRMGRA